jgi:hypothetical protein
MRFLIASTFTLVLLASSLAQAADPQLTKQIAILQQQVAFLQKDLNRLKGVVDLAPDGTTRIIAQQHKQEVTGGNSQVDIGGQFNRQIGQSASESIGTNQSISVGTNQVETVGQDLNQRIGRNAFLQVGTDLNMASGKRTIISAGDQLILRTGQASIVLNKNGDITIEGKNIRIKGSADVIIKGSKVTSN